MSPPGSWTWPGVREKGECPDRGSRTLRRDHDVEAVLWADLREVVILGGVPDRVSAVREVFTVTRTSSSAAGQVIELSEHCDIDDVGQFGPS
jgi:hypothetical protein